MTTASLDAQRGLTGATCTAGSALTHRPPYYFYVSLVVLVVLETLGVVGSIYYAQSGEKPLGKGPMCATVLIMPSYSPHLPAAHLCPRTLL